MSRRAMIQIDKDRLTKMVSSIGPRIAIANLLDISEKTVASWFSREKMPDETLGLILFLSEKGIHIDDIDSLVLNFSEIMFDKRYFCDFLIVLKNEKKIRLEIKSKNNPKSRVYLAEGSIVDFLVIIEKSSDDQFISHNVLKVNNKREQAQIVNLSDKELFNELFRRGYDLKK